MNENTNSNAGANADADIASNTTSTAERAPPTPRRFLTQLRRAVGTAIALNINQEAFNAEATVVFGESSSGSDDGPQLPTMHPDGYHDVPGCAHPAVTPVPLLLGMDLTPHQVDVIMSNTGCDHRGELPANLTPELSRQLGFEGPNGEGSPISWRAATNFERDPKKPEQAKKGSQVPFTPRVLRMQVRTLAEASAAWVDNKF